MADIFSIPGEKDNGDGTFTYDPYDNTMTVKLSREQSTYVKASGEPWSQWIRGAVQERIDRENNGTGWPEVHPSEHPGLH